MLIDLNFQKLPQTEIRKKDEVFDYFVEEKYFSSYYPVQKLNLIDLFVRVFQRSETRQTRILIRDMPIGSIICIL